jgi:hypothetical protein
MGRPLNKKFFGNRNVGTNGNQVDGNLSNSQNYADDRIGGEGVASYGTIVAGSGWTATPTVTFSPPDIPGGVSVDGTAHYQALSATVAVGGTTAYPVGTVVGVTGGSTFTVATLADTGSLSTVTVGTTANLTFDTTTLPIAVGTSILVGGVDTASCGFVPSTYYVSASPTPTATSFTLTSNFANAVAGVNSLGATNAGATTGLTFTYRAGTAPAGVVATVATGDAGDRTSFTATPLATTNTVSATGLTLNVTYGLLSIAVTEKGSGYTSPADAAVSFSGSTGAAATAVLTTDSGAVGSATNQENAIIIHANTSGGGTTAKVGDIIRQVSGRRYKVKTADGIKICQLGTDDAPTPAGAYIIATDSDSNTYYVTKLTAHKATLVRKTFASLGQWQFETSQSALWMLFEGQANPIIGYVKIENA